MSDTLERTPTTTVAKPVDLATQEIRLAITMTGGVSLAIWMGGVAREINLLTQASCWRSTTTAPDAGNVVGESADTTEVRRLYRGLLDLLDVTVETDVLSGSSAGGINSALLAYSRVNSLDLGKLRSLWLDIGSLLTLLRNPADPCRRCCSATTRCSLSSRSSCRSSIPVPDWPEQTPRLRPLCS
jgi:hypothetical protein